MPLKKKGKTPDASFLQRLQSGLNVLNNATRGSAVLEGLTGVSEQARNQDIKAGKAPIPVDKNFTSQPLHSIVNKQISDSFGTDVAAVLGFGKEALFGGIEAAGGKAFVNPGTGEQGLSLQDLRSNFAGQQASVREGSSKAGPISQTIGFLNELELENRDTSNAGQLLLSNKNIKEAAAIAAETAKQGAADAATKVSNFLGFSHGGVVPEARAVELAIQQEQEQIAGPPKPAAPTPEKAKMKIHPADDEGLLDQLMGILFGENE